MKISSMDLYPPHIHTQAHVGDTHTQTHRHAFQLCFSMALATFQALNSQHTYIKWDISSLQRTLLELLQIVT